MIPSPWQFVILALGAYRLLRLVGWDDFPPIAAARARLIGERWIPSAQIVPLPQEEPESIGLGTFLDEGAYVDEEGVTRAGTPPWADRAPELPGKQPSSEVEAVRPAYDRPLLAHLVHCPFCMGWWISLAVAAAWWTAPRLTLLVLLPFALSGVVGLVAKNLDP